MNAIQTGELLRSSLPSSSYTDPCRITAADTGETTGRMLRAHTDLLKNAVAIRIPVAHTIQGRALDRLLSQLGSSVEFLPPTTRMVPMSPIYKKVLVLLHASTCDDDANVFGWKEYVATLPTNFNHMPLFWDKKQINRLGPLLSSTLHNFVQRMNNEVDRAQLDLLPIVEYLVTEHIYSESALQIFDISFLRWAYCSLTSRMFDLTPTADGPQTPADDEITTMEEHGLVPFMDLMNHASTPADATLAVNVETVDGSIDVGPCVIARALRDLKEGDELCFSYRMQGEALKFLFNYGFVPKDAKDVFYLMVEYSSPTSSSTSSSTTISDCLDDTAEEQDEDEDKDKVDNLLGSALESLGLPPTKTIAIPMTDEDPLPELYIWALRVREMHLDVEERSKCLSSFVSGEPLSLLRKHEERVWKCIAESIESAHEFYTDEAEEESSSSGYEDAFVERIRDAAVRVLEKTMAKFACLTGAGGGEEYM